MNVVQLVGLVVGAAGVVIGLAAFKNSRSVRRELRTFTGWRQRSKYPRNRVM